jgi:DNA polymerase-3 subunit gamma/tau
MSQALYRKWRSRTFTEVVGQEHITQTLQNALRDGRIAHAYLFAGPRGTGKTSTARILAKALNCTAPEAERPCDECPTCVAISEGRMLDLIEIDAASNNSVEDIRELRDKVGFRPSEGRYKVYIIDEVHMLSTSAFNALLKTLEEPPPHARFVLATTEPHRIPATVLSRCQRFDFRRIPVPEISAHLQRIAEAEAFQTEPEALAAIARSAQGCMRDAVSLLDQMFSYGHDAVTLQQVQQVLGAVNAQAVADFVDALAEQNVLAGLTLIHELLTQGVSLVEFCHQVIEHLRGVLVLQMTGEAALLHELPAESVRQMQAQAQQMEQARTLWAIKRFGEAVSELKGGYQPQLPLEMALIESIQGSATAVAQVAQTAPVATSAAASAPAPVPTPAAAQSAGPPANGQVQHEQARDAETVAEAAVDGDEEVADATATPQLDEAAIEKLRAQWKRFTHMARERCGHKVQAALNTVRDIAIADGHVIFAFGNNSFTRDMIASANTLPQVEALLTDFLGRGATLECQTGEQAELSSLKHSMQAHAANEGRDPLVDYAVTELGARVVEE